MSSKDESFPSIAGGAFTAADFNPQSALFSSEFTNNDFFRSLRERTSRPQSTFEPPLSVVDSYIDGAAFSRRRSASSSFTGDLHRRILAGTCEYYRFSDENQGKQGARGQVGMNPITGQLSVVKTLGEQFCKEHYGWIYENKKPIGEIFTLRSKTNPLSYLAVDTRNASPKGVPVKGMRKMNLADSSDCHWSYEWFSKISGSPSPYISLQYWGDHFGPPNKHTNQYFLLIKDEGKSFIISKDHVADYGALGITK